MRVALGWTPPDDAPERLEQRAVRQLDPALPELPPDTIRRWRRQPTWMPPETDVLARHRALEGAQRLHLPTRRPPGGYTLEWDLGFVHRHALPGTRRLDRVGATHAVYEGGATAGVDAETLGYVEQAPLPLLQPLERRRLTETGQEVLVAGDGDPLRASSEPLGTLGWIEAFPILPGAPATTGALWGLRTLVRWPQRESWRHAYGVDPAHRDGESVALGGILHRGGPGLVALHASGAGPLWSELTGARPRPRSPRAAARWAAAPLTWESRPSRRSARAATERVRRALQARGGAPAHDPGTRLGWLRRHPAPGWSPLFLAVHPVLRDHFATRSELEARDLGYDVVGVLGHVADLLADRSLDQQPDEVPWGSRYGTGRRYAEGPAGAV